MGKSGIFSNLVRHVAWFLLIKDRKFTFRKVGPLLIYGTSEWDEEIMKILNNYSAIPHFSLLKRYPQKVIIWEHKIGNNPLLETSFLDKDKVRKHGAHYIVFSALYRAFLLRLNFYGISVNSFNRNRVRKAFGNAIKNIPGS